MTAGGSNAWLGTKLIPFLLLTILGQVLEAKEYLHPKLARKENAIRRVIILPARVNCPSTKISDQPYDPSGDLAAAISFAVTQALRKRSVEILDNPFTDLTQDEHGQARRSKNLDERYDVLAEQLQKDPAKVSNGDVTLGGVVSDLHTAADSLVFVRGLVAKEAFLKTLGKSYIPGGGGLLSVLMRDVKLRLDISFADSRTGDILFYTSSYIDWLKLGKQVQKLLRELPTAP
jgi:hypothetical protein